MAAKVKNLINKLVKNGQLEKGLHKANDAYKKKKWKRLFKIYRSRYGKIKEKITWYFKLACQS